MLQQCEIMKLIIYAFVEVLRQKDGTKQLTCDGGNDSEKCKRHEKIIEMIQDMYCYTGGSCSSESEGGRFQSQHLAKVHTGEIRGSDDYES